MINRSILIKNRLSFFKSLKKNETILSSININSNNSINGTSSNNLFNINNINSNNKNNNNNNKRFYSNYSKMTIFDSNIKKIQRDNSVTNVDNPKDYDYLFEEVSDRLADRILDIKEYKCSKVLDFGCRNGLLLKNIEKRGVKFDSYYMVDSSKELLYRDQNEDDKYEVKPTRILLDSLEEKLPIEDQSLDLIVSNLSLHWINDLPGVFGNLKRLLKPNGVFLATLFGEETLTELKDALYLAEIEREGGFSPHVSPFTKISDIGNILSKNRFSLPTVDTEKIIVNYDNMFILMRDLQNMGENNAILKRRNFTSKDTFLAASSIYSHLYGNENGSIPATFQIIFLIGWAPHESQQKPKARGSATRHFSELDSSVGYKLNNSSNPVKIDHSIENLNENNKQEHQKQPNQVIDDSINEPFPQTEDFIIKRLDFHGNFHFDKKVTPNNDGNNDNNNNNNNNNNQKDNGNENTDNKK
ncbi:hypothetical protein DICPUDRAFT_97998 [Dictyostelium purpureum]|uniref:Methyltransferase type 11 domain-containing protein n=1 Tax=Dictyostelium purpureum TaxID=5786 RepID=F0ZLS2_DICPU|nr:uncharacterized protein DICPUDRAFT_97998 [Dictyostelium purpureum]EGC35120.1 hypothetical protein DICPUDRAFT_97998 [Dictyostelium purpureum]|eukprot:XP_003288372.1 hypothetical protein DICPUDRAFT_97998 [Dictyostelium purpureum]